MFPDFRNHILDTYIHIHVRYLGTNQSNIVDIINIFTIMGDTITVISYQMMKSTS